MFIEVLRTLRDQERKESAEENEDHHSKEIRIPVFVEEHEVKEHSASSLFTVLSVLLG